VLNATDNGGIAGPQRSSQGIGTRRPGIELHHRARLLEQRQRTAADSTSAPITRRQWPRPGDARASTERRTDGSSASTARSSASTPEPISSMTGTSDPHSASTSTCSTKPTERKYDGCARRIAPVSGPRTAW